MLQRKNKLWGDLSGSSQPGLGFHKAFQVRRCLARSWRASKGSQGKRRMIAFQLEWTVFAKGEWRVAHIRRARFIQSSWMSRVQESIGNDWGWKGGDRADHESLCKSEKCPKGNGKPLRGSKQTFENQMFVSEGSFGHKVENGMERQDWR